MEIKPEGLPKFIVPPPSFLDASDQPVTNSTVPEERHYEEDEPQINIDEEDLIENNESDDGNAFHVFDEFILN